MFTSKQEVVEFYLDNIGEDNGSQDEYLFYGENYRNIRIDSKIGKAGLVALSQFQDFVMTEMTTFNNLIAAAKLILDGWGCYYSEDDNIFGFRDDPKEYSLIDYCLEVRRRLNLDNLDNTTEYLKQLSDDITTAIETNPILAVI